MSVNRGADARQTEKNVSLLRFDGHIIQLRLFSLLFTRIVSSSPVTIQKAKKKTGPCQCPTFITAPQVFQI